LTLEYLKQRGPGQIHTRYTKVMALPAQALKRQGCLFLLLPPYSPDPNPIEMAFSRLKAHLRRIGARPFDALSEALGNICDLFEPQECWTVMKAAGYASD